MSQNQKNSLPKNTLRNEIATPATPPKEGETKDKPKTKKPIKEKKKGSKENFNPKVSKTEKWRQATGILSLLFAFFLLVTMISFFINWFSGASDDAYANMSFWQILTRKDLEISNLGGRLGTALSMLLIKQGFGIASLLIPIWLLILGVRLSLKHRVLPLRYSFIIFGILMVWISVTLGFILAGSSKFSILGGIVGYEIAETLRGLMGAVGLVLCLLFVLVLLLVLVYNFSLPSVKEKLKHFKDKITSKTASDKEKDDDKNIINADKSTCRDKYNTVEYAVNEHASTEGDDFPANLEVKRKESNNLTIEKIEVPENVSIKKAHSTNIELEIEETDLPVMHTSSSPNTEEKKELIIEKPLVLNDIPKEYIPHNTIDTEYDQRLELENYQFPSPELLDNYGEGVVSVSKEELEENKNKIVVTLNNYGIQIDKIKATIGPTVTLYEIIPAPGVRISKIKNLEDDIALSLSALGIRIIAPIPGKGTIGIEVPNQKPMVVGMKPLLLSEKFKNNNYELPFAIGKSISNEDFVADLAKMPHILMAGATGQGKSVGLNAIIASLLFKKHPSELKFVMVDPKKVELTLFSKIERHYLAKLPDSEEAIITDTKKVVRTLNSLNIEMDARYDLLKDAQVRNIKEYNAKFKSRKLNPEEGHRFLPYIVLVVDEFADLILTAGKEVEHPITRLAQLARAIGIHLIIATQRPSVNIITGTIKANFPARIAFRVISKIDSRTILDTGGADQLIGRGDLIMSQGGDMTRLQCAFIDTPEVERITEFIGSQRGYPSAFALPECNDEDVENGGANIIDASERDELFEEAAYLIVSAQQGSTSLIQRKLKLGYNRAGRIIDQLEAAGIVGPFEGSKAREVRVANEFALEQFLKDLYEKEKNL